MSRPKPTSANPITPQGFDRPSVADRDEHDVGAQGRWQLWIDTGGTFTDCVATDPDGLVHRVKVLSSSALRARVVSRDADHLRLETAWRLPAGFLDGALLRPAGRPSAATTVGSAMIERSAADGRVTLGSGSPDDGALRHSFAPGQTVEIGFDLEAPVLAAHLVTGTPPSTPLPPLALRLATTRGTNALLERRGVAPIFLVTAGLGDLLRIGDQRRPDLFALAIDRPQPLYAQVIEVDERLDAEGGVVTALDLDALRERLAALPGAGVEARTDNACAAVALLHSYRNPAHEQAVADCLRAVGFRHVSVSSDLVPTIKILPRAETAVVDAYLAPIIERYLARVASALEGGTLHVMTSAGGLVRAASYRAKDSLLSGPAGGVVGAAAAGRACGHPRMIAFDMGGTSTDVSRIAGDFTYRFEHRVGDAVVAAPALEIETVAAGGGSICQADGERLRVGPESAGADPGPACYGAGGPLTVTDVNLLLGRLDPSRFAVPIEPAASQRAFEALRDALHGSRSGEDGSDGAEEARPGQAEARPGQAEALLAGCLAIADERMADAIRGISVRRGYDPAEHALVAFGGAGGQHACAVAGKLGITTVILPPAAGLLSAVGLGEAVMERFATRQVLTPLTEVATALPGWLDELGAEATAALGREGSTGREGIAGPEVEIRQQRAEIRLLGQEAVLEVEMPSTSESRIEALAEAFVARYRAAYGYAPPERPLELVTLRVVASERRGGEPSLLLDESLGVEPTAGGADSHVTPHGSRRAFLGSDWQQVPTFDLESLAPGDRFAGPALVFDPHATLVVETGWGGCIAPSRAVILLASSAP